MSELRAAVVFREYQLRALLPSARLLCLRPSRFRPWSRPAERWKALADPERTFRFCDNAGYDACNWLIEPDVAGSLCAACRHNHTIPDLSVAENLVLWRLLELNKHRLFYTLQRLRLPLATRIDDPEHGLAFDFLAESPSPTGPKVLTGHDNGLITIALEEADDAERERRRTQMGEPYRSAAWSLPPRSRPLLLGCAGA